MMSIRMGPRTRGPGASLALGLAVVMLVGACSGESSEPDGTASPSTSETGEDTTAAAATPEESTTTTAAQSESSGQSSDSGCSLEAPASCGGSATLTFGGEAVVFDFFACYFGDDAAKGVGSAGATFAALGQVSVAGGPASVAVNSIERGGIPTYEIVYVPTADPSTQWHGESEDTLLEIEGDHVAYEGNLVEVVDGTVTGQSVVAAFDATCGA